MRLFRRLWLFAILAVLASSQITQVEPIAGQDSTTLRVREDIRTFARDAKKLKALERGIEVMKERSRKNPNDPTGWTYQANIHGTMEADDQHETWNKCQHGHWWFLAWHRAYIYYFERILRDASGDPTLNLPYWDYTQRDCRALPKPFLNPSSPLYNRTRILNSDHEQLADCAVDVSTVLRTKKFANNAGRGGFGGAKVPKMGQFMDPEMCGVLELAPHNTVHTLIGGDMADPLTAARDPIFWLHHANIDRLWESWLALGNTNPTDSVFLNTQLPPLFDETGTRVTHRVLEILNAKALGYGYETLTTTVTKPTKAQLFDWDGDGSELKVVKVASTNTREVDLRRVTDTPLQVTIGQKRDVKQATLLDAETPLNAGTTAVVLNIEGVRFNDPPDVIYCVYLNSPNADHTTGINTASYVGVMAFFEPRSATGHTMPKTRTIRLDATSVIENAKTRSGYDPAKLTVTIVPVGIVVDDRPIKPTTASVLTFQDVTLTIAQRE